MIDVAIDGAAPEIIRNTIRALRGADGGDGVSGSAGSAGEPGGHGGSTDAVITHTIVGDTTVAATFSTHRVFLPLVIRGGE